MNGFRDIELLSSHLDGQLSPSDSARLESRLKSDPQLAAAFEDLRLARGILRKVPARKSPRNFTLTRRMVGARPPLPRAYGFFRFSSALATMLLVATVALNMLSNVRIGVASFVPQGGGGYGGGGQGDSFAAQEAPAATEAPSATEAPAAEMLPLPTMAAPEAADTAREQATATPQLEAPKQPEGEVQSGLERDQVPFQIPWQLVLLAISVICGLIAYAMNRSAKQKWS
jgi:anti-sigma factor RsiW